MSEVRHRSALMPALICAYMSQGLYLLAIQWLAGNRSLLVRPQVVAASVFPAATSILPYAIVFVPLFALVANLFDRRGSFGLVLQQEYASLASVIFYALMAANLVAILISIFFHFSGVQAAYLNSSMQSAEQIRSLFKLPVGLQPELDRQVRDPLLV